MSWFKKKKAMETQSEKVSARDPKPQNPREKLMRDAIKKHDDRFVFWFEDNGFYIHDRYHGVCVRVDGHDLRQLRLILNDVHEAEEKASHDDWLNDVLGKK